MYYNYNKGYLILNLDPNANNLSMEVCRKVGATEITTFYSSPPQLRYPQLSYFRSNAILNSVPKNLS